MSPEFSLNLNAFLMPQDHVFSAEWQDDYILYVLLRQLIFMILFSSESMCMVPMNWKNASACMDMPKY